MPSSRVCKADPSCQVGFNIPAEHSSNLKHSGNASAPSWSRPGIFMEFCAVQPLDCRADIILDFANFCFKLLPHAAEHTNDVVIVL